MSSFNKNTEVRRFISFFIHFHFFFFLLIGIIQFPLAARCCHEDDRSALLSFKSGLDDSSNRLSSWQHENCCNWHGIVCSNNSFRVVSIDLGNKKLEDYFIKEIVHKASDGSDPPNTSLTGKLSASLFKLTHLRYLDLSFNNFQESQIPHKFSDLTTLTHLDLSFSNLSSSISTLFTNISSLKNLHFVDLACNSFKGPLPCSLYNLSQLRHLDLSYNYITGNIHSLISNLKHLHLINLSTNNFHGIIPKSICEILPLQHLVLYRNNFQGTIPSCIAMLPNLETFYASNNSIAGSVSLNIESKLSNLYLSSNMLAGSLDFICNLTRLTYLDLSQNNFTGAIPSCIFKLNNLYVIQLSDNKLHGALPLPPPGISEFYLSNNKFSGEISTEVGKGLSNAYAISLSGNKFSGAIPFSIFPTEPQYITDYIDLSNNNLSGIVPTNIGYCGSLRYLNLGTNNLTGNFPKELKLAKSLKYLQLSNNRLDGTINFISTLHKLEFLNLEYNNFGGSIPTRLGSLQEIKYISLKSNKLTGSIPENIIYLQKLQILDLSLNNLSGSIPQKLGNWNGLIFNDYANDDYGAIQLQMVTKGNIIQVDKLYNYSTLIDLSCNSFNGSIPPEIGLLKLLSSLNLSHNQFSDDIPESLGNLSALESLDLSANRLSGHIPQSLTKSYSLGVLNLSYNMLSGKIPRESHFDTLSLDGFAFAGNDLLCGFPLEKVCEDDHNTSTSNPTDVNEKMLLYAIVSLGFVVGFWGLFLVLLMKKHKWWFPYWRFIDLTAIIIIEYIQKYY